MCSRLSHRGNAVLTSGDAFSIGQLSTSSEGTPFHQNRIRIVSDARIDNQKEILEKIAGAGNPEMTVNEFIFIVYSKLGITFTEHLVGDYSIAIVDENLGKLFLIRDHMGVRPLYYSFKQGASLAFASEPKALLSLDSVSSALNSEKIQEYLQWPSDCRPYQKSTFFRDIFSVIPATVLTADLDLRTNKETYYWKIDPARFRHLTTESLFIAEYQKRFETAVYRRLQPVTGVHVSGGLDSSAVYKVAGKYLPKNSRYSVHFYPGTPESDERVYAHEIVRDNLKNHLQIERHSDPLDGIRQSHAYIDRPDLSTIPTGTKILPELAFFKNKNVTVVLTGHDGDTVVDSGYSYLLNLVVNLRLKEFGECIESDKKSSNAKRIYFVKRALSQKYKTKGFAPALKFLSILLRHKGISFTDSVRIITTSGVGLIRGRKRKSSIRSMSVKHVPSTLTGTTGEHFSRIFSAGIIDINETLNLSGAAFGIEYAHPFLDRDFIEISLFMPEKMRLGPNGLPRHHFREAMIGILPENVRLRASKVHFDKPIWLNLMDTVNACLRDNDIDEETKVELVGIKRGLQTNDSENPDFNEIKKFHRLLFLEIWKNQLKPFKGDEFL